MTLTGSTDKILQWYELRPLRERVLLLICLLVVVFFIWDAAVMSSFDLRKKSARTQTEQLQVELAELSVLEAEVEARRDFDPDAENRRQLLQLQTGMADVERQLQDNIENLVAPQEMPELLKELLVRQKKLQLLSLENLPAEALRIDGLSGDDPLVPVFYRHRLRLEFVGDYMATLAYLKKLEDLPRRMVWEELVIETQDYPQAKVLLQVYTLSLSRGWIGG